jgi:thiol-disulfide isomerase/thioredoxin
MNTARLVVAYVLLGMLLAACPSPADQPEAIPDVDSSDARAVETDSAGIIKPSYIGPAPDFTLVTLAGDSLRLSDLRGQVVLVNFWATWCPPCRAEMPAIEKVYRSFKPLGLEVLAVNLADQDGQAAVSGFIQELGLTFPIPLDLDGSVNARYTLRGLPSSFFIDRQGVIRSVVVGGPMSEALIQSKIEKLLKEKE